MHCPGCGSPMKPNSSTESSSRFKLRFRCICGKEYEYIEDENGTRMIWR